MHIHIAFGHNTKILKDKVQILSDILDGVDYSQDMFIDTLFIYDVSNSFE